MVGLIALAVVRPAMAADYRHRFPLPGPTFGAGWGVNIHFNDEQPGEVAKIVAGGFHWIRQDFSWAGTERQAGKYDFAEYDRLMSSLDKNGVRPIFILDYGNDAYEKGSPRTTESRAAFCRWVEEAMKHFRHRGIVWEMWNEPNISFWQPKPNVNEYIALASAVGQTIRRMAPDEWYIGPATSGFDWSFLRSCFDAGLLTYWDAVSVHAYRGGEPESAVADWGQLRREIDARIGSGRQVPMISGEWGYSELYGGLNRERQGWYVPRQYLTNLMAGVNLHIDYDWKDDGTSPTDPESHFGVVFQNLTPKPAYDAALKLSRALNGFTYRLRLQTASPKDFAVLFRKGREIRVVAWSTDEVTHLMELPLGIKAIIGPAPVVIEPSGSARDLTRLAQWEPVPSPVVVSGGYPWAAALTDLQRIGKLHDSSIAKMRVTPHSAPFTFSIDLPGLPGIKQQVSVVPGQPITLKVAPASGSTPATAVIENPTALPVEGTLNGKTDVALANGEKTKQISLPGHETPSTVRLALSDGGEPVTWHGRYASLSDSLEVGSSVGVALDGDAKILARANADVVATDHGNATRVHYEFSPGWRFLRVLPANTTPLDGQPLLLGMYVKGNGSGDILKMRFTDATGQTFQPDGGNIDWTGWRWVTMSLSDGSAWHWGGANDSTIHYPIHLDTTVLIESPGGRGDKGEILVAGMSILR